MCIGSIAVLVEVWEDGRRARRPPRRRPRRLARLPARGRGGRHRARPPRHPGRGARSRRSHRAAKEPQHDQPQRPESLSPSSPRASAACSIWVNGRGRHALPRRDRLHDREEPRSPACSCSRSLLLTRRTAPGARRCPRSRGSGWAALLAVARDRRQRPVRPLLRGLARAEATQAAFLQKTLVVWVALLAVPLLKRALRRGRTRSRSAACSAARPGSRAASDTVAFGKGEAMILAATLLWSVEVVFVKYLLRSHSAGSRSPRRGWRSGRRCSSAGSRSRASSATLTALSALAVALGPPDRAAPHAPTSRRGTRRSRGRRRSTSRRCSSSAPSSPRSSRARSTAPRSSVGGTVLVAIGSGVIALGGAAPSAGGGAGVTEAAGALLFARYAYPPNALGLCGADSPRHAARVRRRGGERRRPRRARADVRRRVAVPDADRRVRTGSRTRSTRGSSRRTGSGTTSSRTSPPADARAPRRRALPRPARQRRATASLDRRGRRRAAPLLPRVRALSVARPPAQRDRRRAAPRARPVPDDAGARALGRGGVGRRPRASRCSGTTARLRLGEPEPRRVRWRDGGRAFVAPPQPGELVSLHWDFVCDVLTPGAGARLAGVTRRVLAAVNADAGAPLAQSR